MPVNPVTARAVGRNHQLPRPPAIKPSNKPPQETDSSGAIESSASAPTRGEGVVRKLLSGHFRGVAEVRLQINFREEIAAAQQQQGLSVVADGAQSLTTAIGEELAGIPESEALGPDEQSDIDSLFTDFLASVSKVTSTATDPATALIDLQTAAKEFLNSVQQLLAPAPEVLQDAPVLTDPAAIEASVTPEISDAAPSIEASTETSAEATDAAQPVDVPLEDRDLTPILDNLSELIDRVLTDIESELNETSLPEPAPQEGNNGVAFEKFLAIYRSHQQSPTPPEFEQTGDDAAPEPPISETA